PVVQGGRGIRINVQGSVNLGNRLRMLAALAIDDPEQVQAVKMIGLHFKDLSIALLRLSQPTLPMESYRLPEGRCYVSMDWAALFGLLRPALEQLYGLLPHWR